MPEERNASERIARVVADADVLAADLLVGGAARGAMDVVRSHGWIDLLASEPLLADAEGVIGDFADDSLAADWRATVEERVEFVEHPGDDHPGLATAYRGGAGHLLTLDADLRSTRTGMALSKHADVSVKSPAAFRHTFDPEAAYEVAFGEAYSGSDRDPRA